MAEAILSAERARAPAEAGPAGNDLFQRLDRLNEIGSALSLEKNLAALLEKILIAAKTITRADGGTLYLIEGEGAAQQLRFEIVRTASLGVALEEGLRTLKMDGIEKVFQGITDIAQVRAVCIK